MAISVFPTIQTRQMRDRVQGKFVRLSQNNLPTQDDAGQHVKNNLVGVEIRPVYYLNDQLSSRLPAPSFSAQLLELGLKHNVDGLIQKAHEQLSYQGAKPHSAQKNAARHYERAQDNFARDSLHMVERQY